MRPKSIVTFERVVLGSLALGILNAFVTREQSAATMADAGMGAGTALGIQGFSIVITLLLLYFISRKGAPVAKWIYVVLTALGLVFGLFGFGEIAKGGTLPVILTGVQYLLGAFSLYLLFRPDANAWFADGRGS